MESYTIITDGACSGNPGPGGWAAIIIIGTTSEEIFGGENLTTNNIMELRAVIEGLKKITSPSNILIRSDSTYVIKGISEWITKWKKNNWITSSKKPVANKELWIELDSLTSMHSIKWEWVKGHSGDEKNERADELARKGISKILNI